MLGTGDEVLSSLQDFVEQERVHAAALTAIGALSDVTLLCFNWETMCKADMTRTSQKPTRMTRLAA